MRSIRAQVDSLLHNPGGHLSRWARFARFQLELWPFCARRLKENNLLAMSAALSFRTIFALIPLLIFALLVLKSVGVIEDSKESLRQFLRVSGLTRIETQSSHAPPVDDVVLALPPQTPEDVPEIPPDATADASLEAERKVYNVAEEIERLLGEVESKLTFSRIGPIGGALLIWTALTLLMTLEEALNRIFGAPRSRAITRRIVLYWSALTLGPVALVLASFVGRKLIETFMYVPVVRWLFVPLGWLGPILVGVVFVAAVYRLLPNTRVRTRSAISGALVSVPLWLLARWGFTQYIEHLVIKGSLYGVLGLLPLFLIWLNLSWMIFLFGAQLAHTAVNLEGIKRAKLAEEIEIGPSDVIAAAAVVARHFRDGDGPTAFDDICAEINLPGESAQPVIERLVKACILCPASQTDGVRSAYALAVPAERITVAKLLATGDPRKPDQIGATDKKLRELLTEVRDKSAASLGGRTLAELIETTGHTRSAAESGDGTTAPRRQGPLSEKLP
jgi:membrane protein